jgi:hypothetical protein
MESRREWSISNYKGRVRRKDGDWREKRGKWRKKEM